MSKKLIFLWGYMAAGKSRLGVRLAKKLDYQFIDTDREIERRLQLVIPQIFAQFGEEYFRRKETELIREYSHKTNFVISCGGGAPCFNENSVAMLQHGIVVFLDVQTPVLIERLWKNKEDRPLIAKMKNKQALENYIENHLKTRMPYYNRAHFTYDNTYPKADLTDLINMVNNY